VRGYLKIEYCREAGQYISSLEMFRAIDMTLADFAAERLYTLTIQL
jgi:hypothetical protein